MARPQAPLLYNGTCDAIAQLRIQLGIRQFQAARRGQVDKGSWSRWERGRAPGRKMLPKIFAGLRCTEIELWECRAALELKHYRRIAVKEGLTLPSVSPLAFVTRLEWLKTLDLDWLPPMQRRLFGRLQHAALETSTLAELLYGLAEDFYVLGGDEV